MANSTLVCTTSKNVCTATISSATVKKFFKKSTGQKSLSDRNRVTGITGVEDFQESLQMERISSHADRLISHSRIKSSTTNCEPAWGQRTSWCNERQVNSFQAPVNQIIISFRKNLIKGYSIEP